MSINSFVKFHCVNVWKSKRNASERVAGKSIQQLNVIQSITHSQEIILIEIPNNIYQTTDIEICKNFISFSWKPEWNQWKICSIDKEYNGCKIDYFPFT